ncbi:hypothetical protein sos41_33230 [Alphaproteobacteria bacterium SO-S41]|nr:hypothetical protein sos41_33230 [Alphaproteobacteria bacterium SO-S41]
MPTEAEVEAARRTRDAASAEYRQMLDEYEPWEAAGNALTPAMIARRTDILARLDAASQIVAAAAPAWEPEPLRPTGQQDAWPR